MTLATMARPLMMLAATTLMSPTLGSAQGAPAQRFDAKAEARKVVDALAAGRFGEIEARYSTQMLEALPVGRLAAAWSQVTTQVGAMKSVGEPRVEEQDGATIVIFPAEYEGARLNLVIAFNAEHKLVGLLAQPGG